jgi:hypothetical protein
MLNAKIQGIPCQIGDVSYTPYWCGRRGHIDNWLPDEPEQIEFTVYDRKGHYAAWLERKMTADDIANIEELILKEMKDDQDL